MYKLYYLLILVIVFGSCSKGHRCDCFVSNGKELEEVRELSDFTELEIENVFDIKLKVDTINQIRIITGKNLIKGIETVVENNRLYIKNTNKCNWSRKFIGKIKLEISLNNISYINLMGSSDISCTDTLYGNELKVDDWADISNVNLTLDYNSLIYALHAGTGNIILKGKVISANYWNNGYSNFDFNYLITNNCNVMSNSTGFTKINVKDELSAKLFNSGNIYLEGNPSKITSTQNGSGELIRN
ncbi:MAG: DUF2807 domain-containing protein [Bacteroidia bacterium]|nr:DUF2807 domain-containing protein [Bacteroidia bacterium]